MNSISLAKVNNLEHYSCVSIDTTLLNTLRCCIDDSIELLKVSGAGIVLLQQGELRMVVASNKSMMNINPRNFYTQQTFDRNSPNEIMMPFGCLQSEFTDSNVCDDIYYYHGVPIQSPKGQCIGCFFIINNKHCSLSEYGRKTFSILHRVIQLEISHSVMC